MQGRVLAGVGIVMLLLALGSPLAMAAGGWTDIPMHEGDSTTCEFSPGEFTVYEVDASTFPQYEQEKRVVTELPDGNTRVIYWLRRTNVRFLKVDPQAGGPGELVETQRARLRIELSSTGETVSLAGASHMIERSADGGLVDRNRQVFDGFDEDGPNVVSETGVCRP